MGSALPLRPQIVPGPPDEAPDPNPDREVLRQVTEGLEDLHHEHARLPRWPYPELDKVLGPMLPGRVTIVAGNPGNGKTTFALDLMDRLASEDWGLYVLGLEQKPKELRTKWACLRANVDPSIAFEFAWSEYPNGEAMRNAVVAEYLSQAKPPWQQLVHFDPRTKINRNRLIDAANRAAEVGAAILVVDHIDRLDLSGRDPFEELKLMVQLCSELADEQSLHLLVFSQLNRTASNVDRLTRYQPPQLHQLFGGSVKEQEADMVLGLFRPFAADVTPEAMKAVREGRAEPMTILEPNTMGVVLLKHRLRGKYEGKRVNLQLVNGRLHGILEKDKYTTAPSVRGPRP